MSKQSGAELRLSLSDLIANTIYSLLDNESNSPEDEKEKRLAAEDAAENVLDILGMTVMDGLGDSGEIRTVIARNIPDDFRI